LPRNREEADLFFCSVTPLPKVRNKNIGDLQYSPVGPLTIKLIAPDGTSDILFQTPNDYGGSNFENTLFTDSATTSIILGTAPYPGPFLHTDSQFIPLDVTNVAPDPTSSVGPSTG